MAPIKRWPLLLLFLVPVASAAIARSNGTAPAWVALADGRFAEALEQFRSLSAGSRDARLGEAIAWLNVPPKTSGNVSKARQICRELAADPTASDPWTLQARYLLGRIAQYHLSTPDLEEAAAHYLALAEDHPRAEIAQTALVRAAMIQLYAVLPPEELARRFVALEARAPELTFAPARRDLHLLLADVASFFERGAEVTLRHSLAADAAGVIQPMRRLTVLVRIAELSRNLQQTDQALEYYRRYLAEPMLDNRAQLVRDRVAELTGGSSP